MILSPERGEALDLVDYTRRVLDAMERELGTRLDWVAIDRLRSSQSDIPRELMLL
jgi:type IV secretory pathway VirD2 relaxase